MPVFSERIMYLDKMIKVLKNIGWKKKEKKNHNSIIICENCNLWSIFVGIIAYVHKKIAHKVHISRITHKKSQTLLILGKIIAYLFKKGAYLKNSSSSKSQYFNILSWIFANLQRNNITIYKNLLWKIRYFNN